MAAASAAVGEDETHGRCRGEGEELSRCDIESTLTKGDMCPKYIYVIDWNKIAQYSFCCFSIIDRAACIRPCRLDGAGRRDVTLFFLFFGRCINTAVCGVAHANPPSALMNLYKKESRSVGYVGLKRGEKSSFPFLFMRLVLKLFDDRCTVRTLRRGFGNRKTRLAAPPPPPPPASS